MFRQSVVDGKPGVARIPACRGPDEAECRSLAREQFARAMTGRKVLLELPNPANFAAAIQTVTEHDIAGPVPRGPSVEGIARGVKQFTDVGFGRVAPVQIGDRLEEFCEFYERESGEAPRKL